MYMSSVPIAQCLWNSTTSDDSTPAVRTTVDQFKVGMLTDARLPTASSALQRLVVVWGGVLAFHYMHFDCEAAPCSGYRS